MGVPPPPRPLQCCAALCSPHRLSCSLSGSSDGTDCTLPTLLHAWSKPAATPSPLHSRPQFTCQAPSSRTQGLGSVPSPPRKSPTPGAEAQNTGKEHEETEGGRRATSERGPRSPSRGDRRPERVGRQNLTPPSAAPTLSAAETRFTTCGPTSPACGHLARHGLLGSSAPCGPGTCLSSPGEALVPRQSPLFPQSRCPVRQRRSASAVTAPPGGTHSLALGWGTFYALQTSPNHTKRLLVPTSRGCRRVLPRGWVCSQVTFPGGQQGGNKERFRASPPPCAEMGCSTK